ncbi:phospholipid/cholesterol/gamma-HCH transport system substrate-binding protein [Nocardioides albertanoniae]|uniref:Phospholipid/cholesterol/gamma-HCH transport system substrate-binding protein n=1 Tax=Nocardioides albertanoniae TaxID=1175486 RepID=A0A543A2K6_9ACTN|nr:MCE family protein [Nocardioides albertanoniae]TQL66819.1 phospholipid/cholesterol/gamma-HCH transport system substrate-binding protein [Nocardioides albertanoniae]
MAGTRARALAAVLGAAALTLSGCGLGSIGGGVYEAPLPGGADVGDDPITMSAEFADVLDLVPQSSVKVDNVSVGRVSKIRLTENGRSARVSLVVRDDVSLPAGTTARLQQTSLLGEKYVALIRPTTPVAGEPLGDGSVLGRGDTAAAAQVEEVLGALSMVLNSGGIAQFQEISRELQKVSDGKPEEIKAFLHEIDRFVSVLDSRSESITSAIDSLNDLAVTLDKDKSKIANALEGLSPGMRVLVEQRPQLVAMLEALDRLANVTVRTLNAAQDDIVADLKLLDPILDQLAKAGSDLPYALEILFTYPFPDEVLNAIRGDYMNLFMLTNFRTPADCEAKGCDWLQPAVAGGSGGSAPSQAGSPGAPGLLPSTSSSVPGSSSPSMPGPSIIPTTPGSSSPSTSDPSSGDPDPDTSTSPSDPSSSGSPSESPTDPTTEPEAPSTQNTPDGADGGAVEGSP